MNLDLSWILASSLSQKLIINRSNCILAVKQISYESSSSSETISSMLNSLWKRISNNFSKTFSMNSRCKSSSYTTTFFLPVSRFYNINSNSIKLEFLRQYSIMNFLFNKFLYWKENSVSTNILCSSLTHNPLRCKA